jgi:hypothetical protein
MPPICAASPFAAWACHGVIEQDFVAVHESGWKWHQTDMPGQAGDICS